MSDGIGRATGEPLAILFIQCAPSQLDASFYSMLSTQSGGRIALAMMNDGLIERTAPDPELGLIPVFPALDTGCRIYPLPSESNGGLRALLNLIFELRPRMVVVQDQAWRTKVAIALACRGLGIRVAMRSDKNRLSRHAKQGVKRAIEVSVVRALFDALAPVSPLTVDYYRWKERSNIWSFPYPSSRHKFSTADGHIEIRKRIRATLGISGSSPVFLAVVKFVDRENPMGVLRAFAQVRASREDATLIVVGAGPQASELQSFVLERNVGGVHFCGYVPYGALHEYFWASDVFVHLARIEPWGVSAQDALVASLALVTSDKVGAGVSHLSGPLQRFVVPVGDDRAASTAMLDAISTPRGDFSPAWKRVDELYTAEGLASRWAQRLRDLTDQSFCP